MKRVCIICVGDELIKGEIENTNASFISRELAARGVHVSSIAAIPDDHATAVYYGARIVEDEGIYIFTGGLGATQDDVTRTIVSEILGRELVIDKQKLKALQRWYEKRGRAFDDSDRRQAAYPEGGVLLNNQVGLAYGFYVKQGKRSIFALPGVPKEMERMFVSEVLPLLEKENLFSHTYRADILTFSNIPEYSLDKELRNIFSRYEDIRFGTRSSYGLIKVRIESHTAGLLPCIREIEHKLSDYYVGRGGIAIEALVGDLLIQRRLTLSVAESCTAGLLSARITSIPGSSKYFIGGVVSYHNVVKERIIGVSAETLRSDGAVSAETARQMAKGALHRLGSDIALAITGIAGPDGGTPQKPVGTVYICLYNKGNRPKGDDLINDPIVEKYHFPGDRETIRRRSANAALVFLYNYLKGRIKV